MAKAWLDWGRTHGLISAKSHGPRICMTSISPNLRKLGFKRTSEPAYYNCIAYAVGDFKTKWWLATTLRFWPVD